MSMDYKIANQVLYTCDKYGNLGRKNMRQRLFWHL
jgi:YD repeat-containing protein